MTNIRNVQKGVVKGAQTLAPFTSVFKVPFSEEYIIGLRPTEIPFISLEHLP